MGVSRLYIASYGSPIPSSEMYTARAFFDNLNQTENVFATTNRALQYR